MAFWQVIVTALFSVFILSDFTTVETLITSNRKTLQQLCRSAESRNVLELKAFFDLRKSFACLKMETCSRVPVCFVEDTPDLGQESLNDCSLWNLLLQGLQSNRKIEPVPLNSPNGGKSRTDYALDDAVSSPCYGVRNVYRFLTDDTNEEENARTNGTSKNSTTINPLNSRTEATNGSTTTPVTKPKKNRNRRGGPISKFLRQIKRKQVASGNSSCGGLFDNCTRICVGQNERLTNVSYCDTFTIQCTMRKVQRNRKRHRGKGKKKNPKSD